MKKLFSLLFVVVAYFVAQYQGWIPAEDVSPTGTATESRTEPESAGRPGVQAAEPRGQDTTSEGAEAIVQAFRNKRSDFMVQADGVVDRILPDDNEGSRHQKFIVRLANDHTVLMAHNIDLAPRVPIEEGDSVSFKGEYEWNERGGVIHWTHHDPAKRHEEGWIEAAGKRYE